MNIAKLVTRGYFAGALIGSAAHIVTSAHKMGGHGIEAWVTPAMIDGVAILGMHMRSEKYTDRTNRIGFKVQCVMGLASLAMNVYAAKNLFGVLFGIAIVSLFILSEWMSGQIELRADATAEAAAKAQADAVAAKAAADAAAIKAAEDALAAATAWMAQCSHPTKCTSAEQCTKKSEAAAKRSKTVARKNRQRAAQERALESLVNA